MRIVILRILLLIIVWVFEFSSSYADTYHWNGLLGQPDPSILKTSIELPEGNYTFSLENGDRALLVQGSSEFLSWPANTQFTTLGGPHTLYVTIADTSAITRVVYNITPEAGGSSADPIIETITFAPENTAVIDLPTNENASSIDITIRDLGALAAVGSVSSIGLPLASGSGIISTQTDTGEIQMTSFAGGEYSSTISVNPGAFINFSGAASSEVGIIGWHTTVNGDLATGSKIIESSQSNLKFVSLGSFSLTSSTAIRSAIRMPGVASASELSVIIVPYGVGTDAVRFDRNPQNDAVLPNGDVSIEFPPIGENDVVLAPGRYEVFVKAASLSDAVIVQVYSEANIVSEISQHLAGVADFNGQLLPALEITETNSTVNYQISFYDYAYPSTTLVIGYDTNTWEEAFRLNSSDPTVDMALSGSYQLIAYNKESAPPSYRSITVKHDDGTILGGQIVYSAFLTPESNQVILPLTRFQPGVYTMYATSYSFPGDSLTQFEFFAFKENEYNSPTVGFGWIDEESNPNQNSYLGPYQFERSITADLFINYIAVPSQNTYLLGFSMEYELPLPIVMEESELQAPAKAANSEVNASGGGSLSMWFYFAVLVICVFRGKNVNYGFA